MLTDSLPAFAVAAVPVHVLGAPGQAWQPPDPVPRRPSQAPRGPARLGPADSQAKEEGHHVPRVIGIGGVI